MGGRLGYEAGDMHVPVNHVVIHVGLCQVWAGGLGSRLETCMFQLTMWLYM